VIGIGLAIMIASQTLTLLHVEPFWSWNTPIAWTGFILFADGVVWRARSDSWIRSAPRELVLLALVSIPLWLVFEGFNLVIDNWQYSGLPENFWLRQVGYAWSFATIWPAIFEAAELVGVLRTGRATNARQAGRAGRAGQGGGTPLSPLPARPVRPASPALSLSVLVGAAMLVAPFIVTRATARYLAAPLWLGFIFLLDPINLRLGGESLWADWRVGRRDRTIDLMLSGMLCGILWEFWNYWARARWHYTLPVLERWKVFEMPVPGYFGFPPFALECFTMYVFVRLVLVYVTAGFLRTLGPAETGRRIGSVAR